MFTATQDLSREQLVSLVRERETAIDNALRALGRLEGAIAEHTFEREHDSAYDRWRGMTLAVRFQLEQPTRGAGEDETRGPAFQSAGERAA